MKLYTCIAHIDPAKLTYLKSVLHSQKNLFEEVHVDILTNVVDPALIDAIYGVAPPSNGRFQVNVVNRDYDKLPSPWLLAWVHKVLMFEKYQDPSYTHFLNLEDDMEITSKNIEYWLKAREILKSHGLFPSFFRVEWNVALQDWVSVDAVAGDKFFLNQCPRALVTDDYCYVNLPRTYQAMFLYDRVLMDEYINSGRYVVDEAFPHWRQAIQYPTSPMGLGEASHAGISGFNVPNGCLSRNFLPVYTKYNMFDPGCLVHHLDDKYTNIPASLHGKVILKDLLR